MWRRAGVAVGVAVGALAVGAALASHRAFHRQLVAKSVPGGQLMPDVGAYDRLSGLLLRPFYRSVAQNVAATVHPSAAVLEVGCGPGYLSIDMARDHGLAVTGLDLDPDMITRAQHHAERLAAGTAGQPTFVVGDAAALPFDDGAFDVVVSTFSLHHWSDQAAGLAEIARVLRPGGTVLIWDFGGGGHLIHPEVTDPAAPIAASPLRIVSVQPWSWPWRIRLCQRMELTRS